MPFETTHYAASAKTCDDLKADEIVTFGEGRLALVFSSSRVSFCWSHLIDLGSFEMIAVDDLERLPAAIVSLGTGWSIGFEAIAACTTAASFAPGNLMVDDRGTWLVAEGRQRFGIAGSCRGDEEPLPDVLDHRSFRVPAWKLSRGGDASHEPLSLRFGEGKRNAGWFQKKA